MAASSKSKTKAKTARSGTAAVKSGTAPVAPPAKATKPAEVTPAAPSEATEPVVKTKEMLARVAARTELRPNQVRDVYEAVLEELGAALVRGEKLRLPPLGTVKVNRQKAMPNADVVICKIRRNKVSPKANDPLAPTDD